MKKEIPYSKASDMEQRRAVESPGDQLEEKAESTGLGGIGTWSGRC
jgi:hypothetical protein